MILCRDDLCRNFSSLPLPSKIRVHGGQLSKGLELTLHPCSKKYLRNLLASSELDFTVLNLETSEQKSVPRNYVLFMPETNQHVKISRA